jgi:radical SAM enzyme (TIGR01210 family)
VTSAQLTAYPNFSPDRTNWILSRRTARNEVNPLRPYHFLVEPERDGAGDICSVITIFLTNRECPWRCVMCDLWKNTTEESVPLGAIPTQIEYALSQLPRARQIKLYNSGSFFDPNAIHPAEYSKIAALVKGFERVIVECHPAMLGSRCLEFQALFRPATLEVAIGLETAHALTLERLNKRMSLADYSKAARFLGEHEISLRTFLLVNPPFLARSEGLDWTRRSIEFAFDHGSSVVSLIPTRTGNGAMDELARIGYSLEPSISDLEVLLQFGIGQNRGRVFADLWDLERFSKCSKCFEARRSRLEQMNLTQSIPSAVHCEECHLLNES